MTRLISLTALVLVLVLGPTVGAGAADEIVLAELSWDASRARTPGSKRSSSGTAAGQRCWAVARR